MVKDDDYSAVMVKSLAHKNFRANDYSSVMAKCNTDKGLRKFGSLLGTPVYMRAACRLSWVRPSAIRRSV